MAQIVIMPKLGQTVEESTIVKWLKHEGDVVAKGDILFEIETDKAVLEVESFFDGHLLKILVREGETVPVTTPVAFVGTPGESLPDLPKPETKPVQQQPPVAPTLTPPAPSVSQPTQPSLERSSTRQEPPAPREKTFSPRARRLLKELPINQDSINGSGPQGRVVEKDVLNYLENSGYNHLRITPAAKALALKESINVLDIPTPDGHIQVEQVEQAIQMRPQEMSKMRQIIARRLTQSFAEVPHFYVTVSVDMTDLLAFRKNLKKTGKPYSVTDFILKACAMALREYPHVNSSTDGRVIKQNPAVHLGLAVSLPEGLVVPVLRNADQLSLDELHTRVMQMIQDARNGALRPDDMTGSTFTISNMGMMNVDDFTAIINPGESAILAIASIRETPVARKGEIQIRSMMKITLSSDHRLVDGAMAASFVNCIKNRIENIEQWTNMISSS